MSSAPLSRPARPVVLALAVAVAALGSARPASAQFTITLTQLGNTVLATGTGSIDLGTLSFTETVGGNSALFPSYPAASVGSGSASGYRGVPALAPFGPGPGISAASSTGGLVGGFRFDSGFEVFVPVGYVSFAPLASTGTYNGTFATLGLTPGTYRTQWDDGRGSFTVQVGPLETTTAPEPGTWALLGTGLLALAGAARHRTRA